MTFNHHIATASEAVVASDKKVEVSIDGETAVIRMSTYADGIGWFVQKTITVDANMLDALVDNFADARGKIRRESDEILSAEVLEF